MPGRTTLPLSAIKSLQSASLQPTHPRSPLACGRAPGTRTSPPLVPLDFLVPALWRTRARPYLRNPSSRHSVMRTDLDTSSAATPPHSSAPCSTVMHRIQPPSLSAITPSPRPASVDAEAKRQRDRPATVLLTPESTWQELLQALSGSRRIESKVKEILLSEPLLAERHVVHLQNSSLGWRHLHGRLLFALLARRSVAYNRTPGLHAAIEPVRLRWDRTVTAAFRLMRHLSPPGCFQLHFLADLAYLAAQKAHESIIDQIREATLQVLSTPRWRQRLRAFAMSLDGLAVADARQGGETAAASTQHKASPTQLARVGRVHLNLMSAYARINRFDKVQQSFDDLRETQVAPTIRHYQLQLMAVFARHLEGQAQLDEVGRHVDKELSPGRILDDISQLRRSMDQHGVDQDDIFLATVVHGLGSPLRSPLLHSLPRRTIAQFVQAPRSVADAFIDQVGPFAVLASNGPRAADGERAATLTARRRLLSALIQVELDSLRFTERKQGRDRYHRIQQLVQCAATLKSASPAGTAAPTASTASTASNPERGHVQDHDAAAAHIQARYLIEQGWLDMALSILPDLLEGSDDIAHGRFGRLHDAERQDAILKRRSIVILLFSSGIKMRHRSRRRDYAFEVLDTAVRHDSFATLWKDRIEPARRPDGADRDDRDPLCTWNRLWKRYLRSWSADVVQGRSSSGSRASTDPWKTLSSCIQSLLLMFRKFGSGPRRTPAAFETLFSEKGLVRAMLHAAVVGGRWANHVAPGSSAQLLARIELVLQLFSRAGVRPWVWDLSRATLLGYSYRQTRPKVGPQVSQEVVQLLDRYSDARTARREVESVDEDKASPRRRRRGRISVRREKHQGDAPP